MSVITRTLGVLVCVASFAVAVPAQTIGLDGRSGQSSDQPLTVDADYEGFRATIVDAG